MRNTHASHTTLMTPVDASLQLVFENSRIQSRTHTHIYICQHIHSIIYIFMDFPLVISGQPFRIFVSAMFMIGVLRPKLVNLLKMENCPFCVSIEKLCGSIKHLFIFWCVHKYCVYVVVERLINKPAYSGCKSRSSGSGCTA